MAARVGAPLRLASFAVRPRAPYTVAVGREADDSARGRVGRRDPGGAAGGPRPRPRAAGCHAECEAVVGRGEDWEDALEDVEWAAGDVLVVGSSSIGPVARVFLGSRSAKIVQHSPVPVVVVPAAWSPRSWRTKPRARSRLRRAAVKRPVREGAVRVAL